MPDISKYQSNFSRETPERKAINLAMLEAFIPSSVNFIGDNQPVQEEKKVGNFVAVPENDGNEKVPH